MNPFTFRMGLLVARNSLTIRTILAYLDGGMYRYMAIAAVADEPCGQVVGVVC